MNYFNLSFLIILFTMSQSSFAQIDPHSCSRPGEVRITHIDLNLNVNFDSQTLSGGATITIERLLTDKPLWLDIKGLEIKHISDSEKGEELSYTIHPEIEWLGTPLEIKLLPQTHLVKIEYTVPAGAPALQWLKPEQTLSKKASFLFSQSQAILARTWIPLQDSPGIRFSFDAKIQVPIGMIALMSAENPQQISPDGFYTFQMKQPISSYLMSLAVGRLTYQKIGRNTGVYAEPEALEAAAWEFSEMQDMLDAAEKLYGSYRWEQYDVLLLPPSFPFGGMENPRITFATPTILAGDKSLVSLIAHELAHSWSGNLVTNATWNDFWLNEGFTVYFERRIMEALKGKDYAKMLETLGWQDVNHTIADFGKDSPATKLKLQLEGKDPDDGMNDIAYEKGYFLLRTIEELVGREAFDVFLNQHFTKNAFQSLDTETFLTQLYTNLLTTPELKQAIRAEEWIYQPGMPSNAPNVTSLLFEKVEQTLTLEIPDSGTTKLWSTHEWLHYLRHLPKDICLERMIQLDRAFGFTQSGNSEIAAEWFLLAFQKGYEPAYENAKQFMIRTGRRKFIVPLYRELCRTEKGKALAQSIYTEARPNYHFVATATLDPEIL